MKKEIESLPDTVNYRSLAAFLYMEQKDYTAAYNTYKWLDDHSGSNGTELFQFASRAYNDEAFDVAANAFKEAASLSKQKEIIVGALLGEAKSLQQLGEKDYVEDDRPCAGNDSLKELNASLKVYEQIASNFAGTQYIGDAVLNSVGIKMEYFHDFSGAEKLLQDYGNVLVPYGNEGSLLHIRLYLMEGKFQDALSAAIGVLQTGQVNPSGNFGDTTSIDRVKYEAALALYYMGMFDSASYYLNTIMSNPTSDAANDAILLQNIISNNRTNPDALRDYASASAMEISNRIPESAAALSEIVKKYPQVPLAENARFDLASSYCKMGKTADAIASYALLAQDSLGIFADRAQFRICRIYEQTLHEKERAITEYENFLARFPNSIYQDRVREIIRGLMGEKS